MFDVAPQLLSNGLDFWLWTTVSSQCALQQAQLSPFPSIPTHTHTHTHTHTRSDSTLSQGQGSPTHTQQPVSQRGGHPGTLRGLGREQGR